MAMFAANARVRPRFIEQMIRANEDGTYTVTFPNGHAETVVPTFRRYPSDKPVYAKFGDISRIHGKELWPMLLEKAWAQTRKGYLNIVGSKAKTKRWSNAIAGKAADHRNLPGDLSNDELYSVLVEHFLTKKQPVTFYSLGDSFDKKLNKGGVVSNHAYALKNIDTKRRTVDLYNPWGEKSTHVSGKDLAFIRNNFRAVVFVKLAAAVKKSSTLPLTKEESLAANAFPRQTLKQSGYDVFVAGFVKALQATASRSDLKKTVFVSGRRLWKDAKAKARAKTGAVSNTDDRPLYWARLQMIATLRQFSPRKYNITPVEKRLLVKAFEAGSRGRTEIVFAARTKGNKRVLVSGFDPFGFQHGVANLRQANPSGAVALALDGTSVSSGKVNGNIEGIVFPVRFRDFDQGIVERTFRPYMSGKRAVDMIMTISMGGGDLAKQGSKAFELEQYAGRRRSSGNYPDNLGRKEGSESRPIARADLPSGPEFLESSLPYKAIHKGLGRSQTQAESELKYIPRGKKKPVTVPAGGLSAKQQRSAKAVAGSGGGYLSNEVFYRTAALKKDVGGSVRVGHLHVPFQAPPGTEAGAEVRHSSLRTKIIMWVKKIIALALPHI